MENMSNNYATNVKSAIAVNPTFKAICEFNIANYEQGWYEKNKVKMANGTGVLESSEEGITYMASYGDMHRHKLNLAFTSLFSKEDFNKKSVEIIDWGCGQAFATCVLVDFIKKNNIELDLAKFTLIEPSAMALQRGIDHIDAIYQREPQPEMFSINDYADSNLSFSQIQNSGKVKIHLFSNLLDIKTLDLNKVFQNVHSNFEGQNYFVCVSPINGIKLQTFYKMFAEANLLSSNGSSIITEIFRPSAMKKITKSISRVEYIFKTNL